MTASVADDATIARAVEVLTAGGIVCFPTETFYGLAVNALDEAAVARLVDAKGREEGKPIAVIVPDLESARRVWAEPLPARLVELVGLHWPGPLTLVAPGRPGIPSVLVGAAPSPTELGGVGVRVSSHEVAHALASAFGGPITATSANLAGAPSCDTCEAARGQLGTRVDFYLDGGRTPGGPASTVATVSQDGHVRVLRAGAIALT